MNGLNTTVIFDFIFSFTPVLVRLWLVYKQWKFSLTVLETGNTSIKVLADLNQAQDNHHFTGGEKSREFSEILFQRALILFMSILPS